MRSKACSTKTDDIGKNAINTRTQSNSEVEGEQSIAFQNSFGDRANSKFDFKPNPNLMRVKYRWYALTLNIGFLMGYFFCLDNPAETSALLISTFDISETTYSLMYSLYGAVNIFIPFIVGLRMTTIGPARCLIFCCTVVFLGQCIVMGGAFLNSYTVMLGGRLIFASGSESMLVV
jgi:hypothetical protein